MHAALISLALFAAQNPAPDAAAAQAAPAAAPTLQDIIDDAHKHIEGMANNPTNLRAGLALCDKALADPSITKKQRAFVLVDVGRARLRLGDLAKLRGDKKTQLAEYEKGYAAGQEAAKNAPDDAEAVFWEAAMLASLSQAKGVMNSLASVPKIKKLLNRVLKLDPNHSYARETLAKVYHALPGIVGGSDKKAEELFLEVLRRDPKFTPTYVTLAEFYMDTGREDEARKWLKKCLDTPVKGSSIPQDHWRFNRPDCKRLTKKLEGG
jgi:tetratricopeptide (TPR) repeat protein